jgi:hypothetical protein
MAKNPALAVAMIAAATGLAVLVGAAPARSVESASPIVIAVADFDYTDTSGETIDQRAEHKARLDAFTGALRADLARDGRYRIVALSCPQSPCSAKEMVPDDLIDSARAAGAKRLLYGGIHKMSSLISNGRFQVVDLEDKRLAFDRLITFRGDTDEAWRRAERFVAQDIIDTAK